MKTATRCSVSPISASARRELGYSRLSEIAAIRVRFGLGIERDLHFKPRYALSIYTEAARAAGHIVEYGPELEAAAERHNTATA